MIDTLVHEIVGPLARRLGTAVGAGLSGYGLAADDISAVAAGAVALVGIAVDLALVYLKTRKGK